MVLAFVKSQKGNNLLLYNGFLHKKERVIGEKTIWKCATYNKCKCTGRVHTVVDEITKSTQHNHVADTAKIEAKEACNRMKEVAQQLEHSTQGVVSEISQGLSLAATAQLPSVSSLKKTVQRVRNELGGTPANPRNLEELVLPEEYKTTTGDCNNEKLQTIRLTSNEKHYSPTDLDEMSAFVGLLYFAGVKRAQHLNTSELWSTDGTAPE
ncbi:uncharacterized protein [Diabrotica undecimpunctata]|uniref:uncharacterized protein n=1 Tax=Diabrotica undecimpunctata TaxID=50387 RepID=UPI003B631AAE